MKRKCLKKIGVGLNAAANTCGRTFSRHGAKRRVRCSWHAAARQRGWHFNVIKWHASNSGAGVRGAVKRIARYAAPPRRARNAYVARRSQTSSRIASLRVIDSGNARRTRGIFCITANSHCAGGAWRRKRRNVERMQHTAAQHA